MRRIQDNDMTQRQVMDIMEQHGLYVTALTDSGLIGLTDREGNIYDVVMWDGARIITDAHTDVSLRSWLGY